MDEFPRTRLTGAFERRVARRLDRLAPASAPIVVACSGGPDSTAALVAAARTRRAVTAAHFDHRLRPAPEHAADRAAVAELARRLAVPLLCGAREEGAPRSEHAARVARYRWLASACREAGAEVCVTGHTQDDQAETVLLHLVRGSGLAGASGMGEAAPWPVASPGADGLRLVRPLLDIPRGAVEQYISVLGIETRRDPSNEDVGYSRNRLRHRVMPELRALNPRATEALARFAGLARADGEALDEWARAVADADLQLSVGGAEVDRERLRSVPPAVATRVIRLALEALGATGEAAQLLDAVRLLGRRGARVSFRGAELLVGRQLVSVRRTGSGPGGGAAPSPGADRWTGCARC